MHTYRTLFSRFALRVALVSTTTVLFASTPVQAQKYSVVANFGASSGSLGQRLVQSKDGNLYGTTADGGAGFVGTVLKSTRPVRCRCCTRSMVPTVLARLGCSK
jgi:hypothetical protein